MELIGVVRAAFSPSASFFGRTFTRIWSSSTAEETWWQRVLDAHLNSFLAHELRDGLGQDDQRLQGDNLRFSVSLLLNP
jgi:hypothetical protein